MVPDSIQEEIFEIEKGTAEIKYATAKDVASTMAIGRAEQRRRWSATGKSAKEKIGLGCWTRKRLRILGDMGRGGCGCGGKGESKHEMS